MRDNRHLTQTEYGLETAANFYLVLVFESYFMFSKPSIPTCRITLTTDDFINDFFLSFEDILHISTLTPFQSDSHDLYEVGQTSSPPRIDGSASTTPWKAYDSAGGSRPTRHENAKYSVRRHFVKTFKQFTYLLQVKFRTNRTNTTANEGKKL